MNSTPYRSKSSAILTSLGFAVASAIFEKNLGISRVLLHRLRHVSFDRRLGLTQEGLGRGVVFPAVLLEQLAELVEQLFGLVAVAELVMGQGQERDVGRDRKS